MCNFRWFHWLPVPYWWTTWRLPTKLYKVAWNVSTDNSEKMYCTDLRIGVVVKNFVSHNIPISWPLSLNDFELIFLLCDSTTIFSSVWGYTKKRIFIPHMLILPFTHHHNSLSLKEPKKNEFFSQLESCLVRSLAPGSLAAAAIIYYYYYDYYDYYYYYYYYY